MKRSDPQPIVWSQKPSVLTRDESPGSLALESIRQCGGENRYARLIKDEADKNIHISESSIENMRKNIGPRILLLRSE
jgi:hypothetical protein